MLAIVGFISASVVLKQYIKNKKLMLGISISLYSLTVIVVVSRMLSGVHWATDIFGGIIFSVSYITLFYFLKLIVDLKSLKKQAFFIGLLDKGKIKVYNTVNTDETDNTRGKKDDF